MGYLSPSVATDGAPKVFSAPRSCAELPGDKEELDTGENFMLFSSTLFGVCKPSVKKPSRDELLQRGIELNSPRWWSVGSEDTRDNISQRTNRLYKELKKQRIKKKTQLK